MTSPETSLATIQSAPLLRRLAMAFLTTSSVSAAKPTSRRGRVRARRQARRECRGLARNEAAVVRRPSSVWLAKAQLASPPRRQPERPRPQAMPRIPHWPFPRRSRHRSAHSAGRRQQNGAGNECHLRPPARRLRRRWQNPASPTNGWRGCGRDRSAHASAQRSRAGACPGEFTQAGR